MSEGDDSLAGPASQVVEVVPAKVAKAPKPKAKGKSKAKPAKKSSKEVCRPTRAGTNGSGNI